MDFPPRIEWVWCRPVISCLCAMTALVCVCALSLVTWRVMALMVWGSEVCTNFGLIVHKHLRFEMTFVPPRSLPAGLRYCWNSGQAKFTQVRLLHTCYARKVKLELKFIEKSYLFKIWIVRNILFVLTKLIITWNCYATSENINMTNFVAQKFWRD